MKRALTTMLLTAAVLTGVGEVSHAAGPEKVTVAYFLEWPTANQVAQAEKWYDEANWACTVDWRPYNTGVEMAEAMVAGEVDIAYSMGVVPFALAVTAGAPIKVVGVAVDYGRRNDNCVIYKKEAIDRANAHELEGPQGRRAAQYRDTLQDAASSLVFLGVDVGKVEVVDMSPHDIDDAFIGGELAMGCSWGGPAAAHERPRLGAALAPTSRTA